MLKKIGKIYDDKKCNKMNISKQQINLCLLILLLTISSCGTQPTGIIETLEESVPDSNQIEELIQTNNDSQSQLLDQKTTPIDATYAIKKIKEIQDWIDGINDVRQEIDDVEPRIQDIKRWYAEVEKVKTKNCITREKVKEETFYASAEKIPVNQSVEICQINEQFDIITGDFRGIHWSYTVSIYRRDNRAFFVFINGGSESVSYQNRYYFDSNEELIRQIDTEFDEYDDDENGSAKLIPLNPEKLKLADNIKESLDYIKFVLEED